jgi:hypothetical protein
MRDGALPTLYLGLRYLKSKDGKLSVLWVVVGACPDQCNGSLSIPVPTTEFLPPFPVFSPPPRSAAAPTFHSTLTWTFRNPR